MAASTPSSDDFSHSASPTVPDVATTMSPGRMMPVAAAEPPSEMLATSTEEVAANTCGCSCGGCCAPSRSPPSEAGVAAGPDGAAASAASRCLKMRPSGLRSSTSYVCSSGPCHRWRAFVGARRKRRRTWPSTRVWMADSTPATVFFGHMPQPIDADVATTTSPTSMPPLAALLPSYTVEITAPTPAFSRSSIPTGRCTVTSNSSLSSTRTADATTLVLHRCKGRKAGPRSARCLTTESCNAEPAPRSASKEHLMAADLRAAAKRQRTCTCCAWWSVTHGACSPPLPASPTKPDPFAGQSDYARIDSPVTPHPHTPLCACMTT